MQVFGYKLDPGGGCFSWIQLVTSQQEKTVMKMFPWSINHLYSTLQPPSPCWMTCDLFAHGTFLYLNIFNEKERSVFYAFLGVFNFLVLKKVRKVYGWGLRSSHKWWMVSVMYGKVTTGKIFRECSGFCSAYRAIITASGPAPGFW